MWIYENPPGMADSIFAATNALLRSGGRSGQEWGGGGRGREGRCLRLREAVALAEAVLDG